MANLPILYRIQEIYSRLHVLKQTVDELSNDPKIKTLETLRNETELYLAKTAQELNKVKSAEKGLELEIKTCAEHLVSEDKRLYGGSVTSSRELEQIQKKVAEYNKNKAEMEERLLKLMEEDEKLTASSGEHNKRLEACRVEIEAIRNENKFKSEDAVSEARELKTELNDLLNQVPTEFVERFKKIAKAHNGVGIAKMKLDCCGACHVSLSDFMLQKVKRGDDQLIYCENCGRILYY